MTKEDLLLAGADLNSWMNPANDALDKATQLEQAKQDKLDRLASSNTYTVGTNPEQMNTLSAEELQYQFGAGLTNPIQTRADGSKFRYATNPDGTFVTDQFGKNVEEDYTATNRFGNLDTRHLYVGQTPEGNYKVGLAASDVKEGYTPYEARYMDKTKEYPYQNYNEKRAYDGTPGPLGVNPNESLMQVELPSAEAERLERMVHTNKGQLAERAIGQGAISELDADLYGSGKTEYSTPNAPLWNADYDVENAKLDPNTPIARPPKYSTAAKAIADADKYDFDGRLGENIDLLQASLVNEGAKVARLAGTLAGDLDEKTAKFLGLDKEYEKFTKNIEEYADPETGMLKSQKYTGVKDSTIEAFNADQAAGDEAWKKGDYLTAVYMAAKNIDRYFATSVGPSAELFIPFVGVPLYAANRTQDQMIQYSKNNDGKEMAPEDIAKNFGINMALAVPERILIAAGLKGVGTAGTGNKIVNALKVGAGETFQEYGEGVQETQASQKEGERTLGDIMTDPSQVYQGVVGGIVGTGVAGAPAAPGVALKTAGTAGKIATAPIGWMVNAKNARDVKKLQANIEAEVDSVVEGMEFTPETTGETLDTFAPISTIQAESVDAQDFKTKLKEQNVKVLEELFTVEDGQITGLNEATKELYNNNPEEFAAKMEQFGDWMTDYSSTFEGTSLQQGALDIKQQGLDAVTTFESDNALEQGKDATAETLKNEIDTNFEDLSTEEKIENVRNYVNNKITQVDAQLSEEEVNDLVGRVENKFRLSGMNLGNGINVVPTFDSVQEVGLRNKNIKEGAENYKEPVTEITTVSNNILSNILTNGITKENLTFVYNTGNTKFVDRVIKTLSSDNRNEQGNLSKDVKNVGTKINTAVDNVSTDRATKVFKGDSDIKGNLTRLAVVALNEINSAVVSDTEQRNTVEADDVNLAKNEYYASKNSLITQIGKEYVNSYGLKLEGNDEKILAQYRMIGSLALDMLSDPEANLIKESEGNVAFRIGDKTFTKDNERMASSKAAKDFDRAEGIDTVTDEKVILFEDKGIRLSDTALSNRELIEYDSKDGNAIKRLAKIILPNSVYAPTNQPEVRDIKTDPEVVPTKKVINTIKNLREEPFKIKQSFVDLLLELKELRKDKTLNELLKDEKIAAGLSLTPIGSRILELNDRGRKNAKIDALNDIIDNLDVFIDEEGNPQDIYFDYQVDINNRITLIQTVMNFQHDKVFARNLLTKSEGEYTISDAKEKKYFIDQVMDELGVEKDSAEYKKIVSFAKSFGSKESNKIEYLGRLITGKESGKYFGEFTNKSFKLASLLNAVNSIEAAKGGDITTDYMIEMDASASGVFNTLINLLGQDVETLKPMLQKLGVTIDGKVDTRSDAYSFLSEQVVKDLEANTETEGTEEVNLLSELREIGINERELAKPAVMTWFYSAGEKSISKNMLESIVQQVIEKALSGDKKALSHIKRVTGKSSVTPNTVKMFNRRGPEHKALLKEYATLTNFYTKALAKTFKPVAEYKKEISSLFEILRKNSVVEGKDFWNGKIRSASKALENDNAPVRGKNGKLEGVTSIYANKEIDVGYSAQEKFEMGLTDDESNTALLTKNKRLPNQTSLGPLIEQGKDAAQLFAALDAVLGTEGRENTGVMTVHDAIYGTPAELFKMQEGYHKAVKDTAIQNDNIETMVTAMEYVVTNLKQAVLSGKLNEKEKAAANANIKNLEEAIKDTRAKNDPALKAKKELLKDSKVAMFGIQDETEVETETTTTGPEVETETETTQEQTEKPDVTEEDVDTTTPFDEATSANNSNYDGTNYVNDVIEEFRNSRKQIKDVALLVRKLIADDGSKERFYGKVLKALDEGKVVATVWGTKDISTRNKFASMLRNLKYSQDDKAAIEARYDEIMAELRAGQAAEVGGIVFMPEFTKDTKTDDVVTQLAHEVTHAATKSYIDERQNMAEVRYLFNAVRKLDASKVVNERLKYALGQTETIDKVNELIAVYNESQETRDAVAKEIDSLLGKKNRVIETIKNIVRKVKELVGDILAGKVDVNKFFDITEEPVSDKLLAAIEVVSNRAVNAQIDSVNTKVNNFGGATKPLADKSAAANAYASRMLIGYASSLQDQLEPSVVKWHRWAKGKSGIYTEVTNLISEGFGDSQVWAKLKANLFLTGDIDMKKLNKAVTLANTIARRNFAISDKELPALDKKVAKAIPNKKLRKQVDVLFAKINLGNLIQFQEIENKLIDGVALEDIIAEVEKTASEADKLKATRVKDYMLHRKVAKNTQNTGSNKKAALLATLYALNEGNQRLYKVYRNLLETNKDLFVDLSTLSKTVYTLNQTVQRGLGSTSVGTGSGKVYQGYDEAGTMDVFDTNLEFKVISLEEFDLNEGYENSPWKVLSAPDKKGTMGIVYRKSGNSFQEGVGVNENRIKNGILLEPSYVNDMKKKHGENWLTDNNIVYDEDNGNYPVYRKILTQEQFEKAGGLNDVAHSLYRTYIQHKSLIEAQSARKLIMEEMIVDGSEGGLDALNTRIKDNKKVKAEKRKEVKPFIKTKLSYVELKAKYPQIAKMYKKVENISNYGDFDKEIQYVRKDMADMLVGHKQSLFMPDEYPNLQKYERVYKELVQMLKLKMVVADPVKLGVDYLSNLGILMTMDVPADEIGARVKEAFKYSQEMSEIESNLVSTKVELSLAEGAKNEARIKKAKAEVEKAQAKLEAHPYYDAVKHGFIQSMGTEMMIKEFDTVTGLQHTIDQVVTMIVKDKKGNPNELHRAITTWMHAGFGLNDILDAAGNMSKIKGTGFGEELLEMSQRLKDKKIKGQEDVVRYISEFLASPSSEIIRQGSRAMQLGDATSRWALYNSRLKNALDKKGIKYVDGTSEEFYKSVEAAIKAGKLTQADWDSMREEEGLFALHMFIDYRINMPKEIKALSDYGILMFPSFWMRAQKIIWNLAKYHPLNAGGGYLAADLLNLNGASILDANIANKILSGTAVHAGQDVLSIDTFLLGAKSF